MRWIHRTTTSFIKVSFPSYFDKYCFISWVRGRRQLIYLLPHSRGSSSDNLPYCWYMWLLYWHSWSCVGFDRSNWGAIMDYHSSSSYLLWPQIRLTIGGRHMSCVQGCFQNPVSLSYEPKAGRYFMRIVGLLTRDFEISSQLLVRPNSKCILQRL